MVGDGRLELPTSCMSRGAGPNRQPAYFQTITSIRTPYDDFKTAPNAPNAFKRGQKCTPNVLEVVARWHRLLRWLWGMEGVVKYSRTFRISHVME